VLEDEITLYVLTKHIQIFLRKIRSVPWRFVFLLIFPVFIPTIIIFYYFQPEVSILKSSWMITAYFLYIFYFLMMTILFPILFRKYYRKRINNLLSNSYCPHCGYSLIGLHCREDGFTLCPECGVAWQLPERVTKPSSHSYRLEFVAACLIILLFTVYIIWSIELGNPIFSSIHMVVFYAMIFGIFVTSIRWINSKKNRPRLVIPNYHDLQQANCPACHVVLDGVSMDWDGVSTCSQCGAVWKIPDGEVDGEFSEPTKFGRKYLVPTRVVDREGKQVLRLRPRNDWNAFIIKSLMKKQCPGCLCSLSGLEVDDEGMTRCTECEAVWVLPGEEDVDCYEGNSEEG